MFGYLNDYLQATDKNPNAATKYNKALFIVTA